MAIRSAKRAVGFARGLSTQARINQARSRAGALGYDIRTVRADWRQTPQEFGVMMGLGLLSAVTVERWELGLEKPPGYIEVWVLRQRQGIQLRRRLQVRYEDQLDDRCYGRFAPRDRKAHGR